MEYTTDNYENIFSDQLTDNIVIHDHLGGFLPGYKNYILEHINNNYPGSTVIVSTLLLPEVNEKYSNIKFEYNHPYFLFSSLETYFTHPEIKFENFVCSFNGGSHVSRQILTSMLHKQGMFDSRYSSKNFVVSPESVFGHISNYVDNPELCSKFIIDFNSEFYNTNYSFGFLKNKHEKNIYNLEGKITNSFLHLVSESMATSAHPFVTEKFLYSIVTRGLYLAYGQVGWHSFVEKYFGFRKFEKIFNYEFDEIQNPIHRLIKLLEMINKFKTLSKDDWRDLYLMEQETIEFNHQHYFSKGYLKQLKRVAEFK